MSKFNQNLLTLLLLLFMVPAIQYILVDKRSVLCNHPGRMYSFDVSKDSVTFYTEDDLYIGSIPRSNVANVIQLIGE